MQTSLLALDSTSVAGEEASLLENAALLRVELVQGTSNSQAQSTGLTGRATTVDVGLDVELALALDQDQRILDLLLVQLVREVILELAAVADNLAGTSGQNDAGDSALTTTDSLNRTIQGQRCSRSSLSLGLGSNCVADGRGELFSGSSSGSLNIVVGSLGGLYVLVLIDVLWVGHCATALIS